MTSEVQHSSRNFVESKLRLPDGAMDWDSDNGLAVAAGLSSWYNLLKDSPLTLGERRSDRQVRRFVSQLSKDFRQTILDYAELGHKFSRSIKWLNGESVCEFLPAFQRTPIFREYLAFTQTQDPGLFSWIMMFCNWLKKLKYAQEGQESRALLQWQATQDRLANFSLPDHVLADLRVVMREILGGIDYRDFWPKHGPGTVSGAGGITHSVEKHELLRYNPDLQDVFDLAGRIQASNVQRGLIVPSDDWYTRYGQDVSNPALAEWLAVYKDIFKMRAICRETAENQYAQQGLLRCFEAAFERNPYTRGIIKLRDQGYNQKLALQASIDSSLFTLDMKDASDSVMWKLVEAIFPSDWVWALDRTRAKGVTLPDGSITRLATFAPMGSAVCFPVECLTFLAITFLASVIYETGIPHNVYLARKRRLPARVIRSKLLTILKSTGQYGVYGDDIIGPNNRFDGVVMLLQSCGFLVNEGKSFAHDLVVRESCGIYAFKGFDVTFLRFLVDFLRDPSSMQASLCELHNALDSRCLFYTKDFIATLLDPNVVTFVAHDSAFLRMPYFAIGDPNSNTGRVRYDKELQRYYVQRLRPFVANLDGEETDASPDLDERRNYVKIIWSPDRQYLGAVDLRSWSEQKYRYGQALAKPSNTTGGQHELWGVKRSLVVKWRRTPIHY